MSVERITKFNVIVGNPPKTIDNTQQEIWDQLELQARLVLEEAKEMYEAVRNKDIVEVLDGSVDVWYLREYMDDILKSLGVDVTKAKYEVCYNNDQKYTTSSDLAMNTWAEFAKQGKPSEVVSVEYDGTTYYIVKIDGKVQKLLHHVRPNLEQCIPLSLKEKLDVK